MLIVTHLKTILFIAALAGTSSVWAQIYKVTDGKNGVVFTDRPETVDSTQQSTIEKLDVPETNTAISIEPAPRNTTFNESVDSKKAVRSHVQISSPDNESTVAMGGGNFSVSASATPALSNGEQLVLMVDGQAFGEPQSGTTWFLQGIMRGPHDLVVQRNTAGGKNITSSQPVRVYVLRPSIGGR